MTSGGKKIAPQPIENVLKQSPLIAEAVVLGDRRKRRGADRAGVRRARAAAARSRTPTLVAGWRSGAERAQLVERPDVRALYQEIVDGINRELSQFERIKRIAILPREFSIESGELTPSPEGTAQNRRAEVGGDDRGGCTQSPRPNPKLVG